MIGSGLQTPCDIAFKLLDNKGSVIFDGTNDFVDASTVSSRISKISGTISHWVRITTSSNNEVLFSCSDGTSGDDKVQTVFMTSTSSGQFQAVYKAGGTAYKAVYNFAASSIPSQGWFHLAMTYDKVDTDLTIKLYFNGVLQNTFSGTADTIGESVTFDRVILGKNANADNSYLTGYMDECAYFSRVLSGKEIARIYNEKGKFNYAEDLSLTGSANALKQWLRFGDGKLDITNDQAASIFTGVIFDMSNATLGSELVDDGNYSNGLARWATYGTTSADNGIATIGPTSNSGIFQLILTEGDFYIAQINVVSFNAGESGGVGQVVNNNGAVLQTISSAGLKTFAFRHGISDQHILIRALNNSTLQVNSVSVKKIQGNPAFTDGALVNQNNLPG